MRLKFWKMKPIFLARRWAWRRAEILATFSPFKIYSPLDARSKRPIIFNNVVLPQPLGPIIIMNSPRLMVRSKSWRANDSASP